MVVDMVKILKNIEISIKGLATASSIDTLLPEYSITTGTNWVVNSIENLPLRKHGFS